MRRGQDMRHAVRLAEMHLFAELQAAQRAAREGSGVRYGRRVVQVALPAEKEIVSYPRPIAGGRLARAVSEGVCCDVDVRVRARARRFRRRCVFAPAGKNSSEIRFTRPWKKTEWDGVFSRRSDHCVYRVGGSVPGRGRVKYRPKIPILRYTISTYR